MNDDQASTGDLRAELESLIVRRSVGEIRVDEMARLESLLLSHPAAGRLYVQYINDTLSLYELTTTEHRGPLPAGAQPQAGNRARRWLARWPALLATLAASLLLAIALLGRGWLRPALPVDSAAKLVRCANVKWSDVGPAEGETLLPGRALQLAAGLAEIKFQSGARVVMEGPAQLTVESAGAGKLEAGKLVARVPPRAAGFTIHTPTETIVDRGTEFGVMVKADGSRAAMHSEVHVFKGRVDVATSSTSHVLSAGQALRTLAASAPTPIATQPSQFVRELPPLLADNFESYAAGSNLHGRPHWQLYYGRDGKGGEQRARVVQPSHSPARIFGQRVVELIDTYPNPRFANPLLEATLSDRNIAEDLTIQFDFRRLGPASAPRLTLHNAPWNLQLGPELALTGTNIPLGTIDPDQWYRLTLRSPSSPHGGKLQVRLARLEGDQFTDALTGEYEVGPAAANDRIQFTFATKSQRALGGTWQIDNVRVEVTE